VSRIVHYGDAQAIIGGELAAVKPLLARFAEYPGLTRVRRDASRPDDARKYYYFLEPNAVHIYNALLRLVIALETEEDRAAAEPEA